MKVVVASSGLGRVRRGIETWAFTLAHALGKRGVDTTLCGGPGVARLRNGGAGGSLRIVELPCLSRDEVCATRLARFTPGGFWRWGWKSAYGWEQFSFWLRLLPVLRQQSIDIVHVQDPVLADWCRRSRRMGLLRTREILAHGTEEPPEFLRRFPCVQHLAPWHGELLAAFESSTGAAGRKFRTAIPNFVDTERFRPRGAADEEERCRSRTALEIPPEAQVVGCVAAVKKSHKRLDHLIREFASYRQRMKGGTESPSPFLLIAGARETQTDDLIAMARREVPGGIRILTDCDPAAMPALYRAMDVFVLPSLFEMMPIALLEAMACGVPVVAHQHPVLEWMVGEGGSCIDMGANGVLAESLGQMNEAWRVRCGEQARKRAEQMFSVKVVVDRILAMYGSVMAIPRMP